MEEMEAFFEPTLAALFVQEVFSPSTQSAVREGSSPAPFPPHPAPPNCLDFALLSGLRGQGIGQLQKENPGRDTLLGGLHGLAVDTRSTRHALTRSPDLPARCVSSTIK